MQIISQHLFSREIPGGGTSPHPFFFAVTLKEGRKSSYTYICSYIVQVPK